MKKLTSISIPDTISFADLKLTRDSDGMVAFDWAPINHICAASGIDASIFTEQTEDNVSSLIVSWYQAHITNGGKPDAVAEDLLAEIKLENEHGGGLSHQPGKA
ncbi:hypothetical protein [Neptunicella sp.]|uniref:hypothetical protein n=1 Tax=Neptunicella sp. TaxID=2125986 RepID=UPI003F68D417